MLETQLAKKALEIVLNVLNKMTDGAVDEAGSQIFQFLQKKFEGIFQLDRAKENPEQLEAVILDAVSEDRSFKEDLEQLVLSYQKQEQNQVIQNNQYGPNINNAHNNTFIAQQQNIENASFRNE